MLSILDPSDKVTYQSLLSYVLHMPVINELPVASHLLFLNAKFCVLKVAAHKVSPRLECMHL